MYRSNTNNPGWGSVPRGRYTPRVVVRRRSTCSTTSTALPNWHRHAVASSPPAPLTGGRIRRRTDKVPTRRAKYSSLDLRPGEMNPWRYEGRSTTRPQQPERTDRATTTMRGLRTLATDMAEGVLNDMHDALKHEYGDREKRRLRKKAKRKEKRRILRRMKYARQATSIIDCGDNAPQSRPKSTSGEYTPVGQ